MFFFLNRTLDLFALHCSFSLCLLFPSSLQVLSCASSIPLSQSNSDFIDPGCFAASLAQIPEPSTSRCSQPFDCLVHPVEQLKDGKNSLPSPHQRSYICMYVSVCLSNCLSVCLSLSLSSDRYVYR